MKVDLYTDAGCKNGVATWATVAMIPGLEEAIEASGRLRSDTNCSATAECRAIANAIHRLSKLGHLPHGSSVRVITDSRHAADRIMGRLTKRPESNMAKAVAVIHALAAEKGLKVTTLWVHGHKPDSFSPYARGNNRCDALCRAARALPRPTKARKALEVARRLEGRA